MVYGDWLFERREFRQAAAGEFRGFHHMLVLIADYICSLCGSQKSTKGDGRV